MTRKMKDSGVEWIGEIPENWETRRLKNGLRKKKVIIKKYDNQPILSLTMNGVSLRDLVNPKGKMPTTFDGYQEITPGNIIECLFDIDVTPRCVGIARDYGLTSPAYTQFEVINDFDTDFIYYYLLMLDNDKILVPISKSLRNTITSDEFLILPFSFPPVEEQRRISNRISRETARINSIISKTQQSIDELKKYKQALITETVTKGLDKNVEMKDSGIDILPSIPTSWKIQKIKNLFSMNKGLSITKENLEDNGIPVISYGEIHSKYGFNFDPTKDFVRNVPESFVQSDKQAILHKGDFVFADTSEDIEGSGNFTCFTGNVTTFAGYHTVILKAKANFNHQYVAYLFDSKIFRSQIQKNVQGIKVFSITQRILKDQWIWLPPIEVQENIVSFLDKKRIIINQMIDNKIAELMELESYKKALIYEYVTGKKEA
ncbi:MAG: restriction endonuclease subunit S [Enterococcus faecium]|nr:restriction endonuclease subunit S [Enterococcus faecium]MDU3150772.1 restriction endonuclease subunit S [Enterococcus faecium]